MFTAKNTQGEWVTITRNNATHLKSSSYHYFCLSCGEELFIKAGDKKLPHFAHRHSSKCRFSSEPESEHHLSGKFQISNWALLQGMPVNLEYFFKDIKRQADIFVDDHTVLELQCSTIPISQMCARTIDYEKLQLKVYWILAQDLTCIKGRYHLTIFQQSFIKWDRRLGYYLLTYNTENREFILLYHLTYESGNRFFSSVMHLPLFLSLKEMYERIERVKYHEFYVKRNRVLERQKICYYYAKFKSRGLFMRKVYEAGYHLQSLPKQVGITLAKQFLVITPAIEWQFFLYDSFFGRLEVGESFAKEQLVKRYSNIVHPKKMIALAPFESLGLLDEYLSYLEREGICVEISRGCYMLKQKMLVMEPFSTY
ncbi:competence protein CoiA family protein [Listeria sp. PSOL-1]|uniref:competence protein CoiA family protein n=1 Tax=Listeria sp. PSOL-1 TaxID=1844999 RepID=UPI0013D88C5D|nr:competence protein CoiA family protein [Listeria sp. PSOL-1]